jgi:hypothetical protein
MVEVTVVTNVEMNDRETSVRVLEVAVNQPPVTTINLRIQGLEPANQPANKKETKQTQASNVHNNNLHNNNPHNNSL